MTSPPVPIQQLPGVGDRIGAAIEPFLQAMRERSEREQRKQQLLIQMGQLKLQQDRDAEERKQTNEKRKGLEEMGAGLQQEIAKLDEPGPLTREIQGAMQSGDPQLMEATMTRVRRAGANERVMAVRQKYGEMAKQSGGQLTPDKQLALYDELLVADPDNPNAGAIANVANTLRSSMRPRGGSTQIIQRVIGGNPHSVLINKDTGDVIKDLGEKPPSYADVIERYGTATQQKSGDAYVRFARAYSVIKDVGADETIRNEVTTAISTIEALGTVPLNLAALARYTGEAATRGNISEGAQVLLNNIYDMLSTEAFARGGATLTANEWAAAIRSLAPIINDSEASWQDKLARMDARTKTLRVMSGPTGRNLENTGLFPELNVRTRTSAPEKKPETLEEKLRRLRGIGR